MLSATLKSEIDRLPLQDKLEVFEAIRDSVMPPSEGKFPELSAQQRQEMLRRAERASENSRSGRSWAEVKQRMES